MKRVWEWVKRKLFYINHFHYKEREYKKPWRQQPKNEKKIMKIEKIIRIYDTKWAKG